MDHNQLKEKLFEYYDGEVSPIEHAEIHSHIESCSECRVSLQDWRRISTTFFKTNPKLQSDFFVGRVMARLEAAPQPFPFGFLSPLLKMSFAGASLALALVALNSSSSPVTVDSLLLADGRSQTNTNWIFEENEVETGELLGYSMEER